LTGLVTLPETSKKEMVMGERAQRPPARRIPLAGPRSVAQEGPGLIVVVGKWTGRSAAALRTALRDTVEEYAGRLSVGVSTAGDWEERPDVVPHPVNQQALDEVLRRADDEVRRRFDVLTEGDRYVRVTDSSVVTQNGGGTDRRHVTKGAVAAGVAGALAPLEVLERIAAQDAYPVDPGLVAAHEKFADALAELGPTRRPDELVGPVAECADDLVVLLERPMGEANRRRVEAAAAGAYAQAGMNALCLADRRLARGCFALARDMAEDSGDDTLRAQVVGVRAILLSPPPVGSGDPRRQADRLSEAVHYARRADSGTRVMLHRWLATALAGKRDERGFRRAVEAADRLAGRTGATGDGGWLARHFAGASGGGGERAKSLGQGLLLLGRPGPAVEELTSALASVDPGVGTVKAVLLADIAAARVLLGEPEATCAGLREALDLVRQLGSYRMGMQRIVGVRLGFPKPWAGLGCVRELDDRLRQAA
jgi:hypothetical protein